MNMHSSNELEQRCGRLQEFHMQDTDNIDLACDLIDTLLNLGKPEEAALVYQRTQTADPENPMLRFRFSSILLAKGDFVCASDHLQNMRKDGVDNIGVRYNHALARLCIDDPETAAEIIEPIIDEWQNYPPLLLLAARVAHAQREPQCAQEHLDLYRETDPTSIEAMALHSLLLLDMGSPEKALKLAREALNHDPRRLEALLAAAGAAIQLDDFESAAQYAQVATEHYPDSGRSWSLMAQVQLDQAQLTDARHSLELATRHMPGHIGTWHMLGWLDIIAEKLEDAENCFQKAYEIDRNFDETHGGLGVVHALRQRWAEAKEASRRAIKLNPQSFSGRYARSLILAYEGRSEDAKNIIDEILKGAPPVGSVPVAELVRQKIDDIERQTSSGK